VLSNVFGAYVVTSVENDATIADELPVMQQRATRARRRQA
jgi:hypothetical protein